MDYHTSQGTYNSYLCFKMFLTRIQLGQMSKAMGCDSLLNFQLFPYVAVNIDV